MLRKIQTSQLELGMFIHAMEVSWFDHPFWRTRFLLENRDQLKQIVAADVRIVTIDEGRGKKFSEPAVQAEARRTENDPIRRPQIDPARKPMAIAQPVSYMRELPEPAFNRLTPREHAAELRKASTTIKRSRTAITNLFADARLGNSVKTRKMAPLVERISNSVDVDPTIILNIARLKSKDEYTYLHSVAVCALMINLARHMRLPESQMHDIGMAGLLHDVGKTAVPDEILSKPGKLDELEWTAVRDHPQRGHDILSASDGVGNIALEVCLHHHEKMDGTGYPAKIPADNFSVFTRMSAICDVYDALTSQRAYNTPLTASQALAKMQSWTGHFDKLILRDFVDSLGIMPVGTLVRMDQDELAVVIGESPANYAAPIVRTFYSLDKDREIVPKDIDTGRKQPRKLLTIEDPEAWGFSDWPLVSAQVLHKAPPT